MKKHILLTTTAMLLSAITLNANADSNSATLEIYVDVMAPFEITQEQYLGFGKILAGEKDKTVIVTPDGKLGEGSTATVLSKASFTNYYNNRSGTALGSFNEGLFKIKNPEFSGALNEDVLNAGFIVNFAPTSVDMIAQESGLKCGTVSAFTPRFKPAAEGELYLHIGGTFTTDKMSQGASCHGATTITIVLNEDYLESTVNDIINNNINNH